MTLERSSGVDLQERDFELLVGLFECRIMSLRHLCELYFDGKPEAAKKRIQKLKAAGLLRERPRRIGEPSLLHLTTKAFTVLQSSGRLTTYPPITLAAMEKRAQVSALTVRHELEVMDVRSAFLKGFERSRDLQITEFSTWPLLYQFVSQHLSPIHGRRELLSRPDGFLRIQEREGDGTYEHLFFLELDRSTETQKIVAQKAACYLNFYQSGGKAERFGAPREDFRLFPFRVLMVFRNEERRNNAAAQLLQNTPPILTQVWLCTLKDLCANPLGEIWITPKSFLNVTVNTAFDPRRSSGSVVYRRQSEREVLVRQKAQLCSLFARSSRGQ